MFVKGTISIKAQGGDYRNNRDTEGVFKNCSSFTNCIGEINNIQIDNATDIHIVMSMYILVIQYGNFWRTFKMSLMLLTWADKCILTDNDKKSTT